MFIIIASYKLYYYFTYSYILIVKFIGVMYRPASKFTLYRRRHVMKTNRVHVEKGMHGLWLTVRKGSCTLRLCDLSVTHELSMMYFAVTGYDDAQLVGLLVKTNC